MISLPGPYRGLRIGLLGGSFNPAHEGHRHVAETALKRLKLDWVWWIVARGNPLKLDHGDYRGRFASALILSEHPRMRVSDMEAAAGLTYTQDTLSHLQALCVDTQFVWLMGADNLVGFHLWRGWRDIALSMPIAVVARPGVGPGARNSVFARTFAKARLPACAGPSLPGTKAPAWLYLPARLHPESSTRLRGLEEGEA